MTFTRWIITIATFTAFWGVGALALRFIILNIS